MVKTVNPNLSLPGAGNDPGQDIHHHRDTNQGELVMLRKILSHSAHHFNNLLAPMMTYPELIRLNYHDREKVFRYLQAIETATLNMADRNRDLLILGRRGSYRCQTLDVNRLIDHLLHEGEHRGTLSIKKHLAADILPLQGGREELERILYHLIRNARQAMGNSGVLTVKTENYYLDRSVETYKTVPAGEYVKIIVSDTGPGIGEEEVYRMNNFSALAEQDNGMNGLALGLNVVADVVRNHKGYVDVEVRKGVGTSFYIYLPVTRQENLEKLPEGEVTGSEKILIVDDDPGQLDLCRRVLSNLGYQVSTAQSGKEAVATCERSAAGDQPFNLLVMDLVMVGADAVETYKTIKGIFPGQKAILLSGYTPEEAINILQKWGAGPYLKKPIQTHLLVEAVRTTLRGVNERMVH